jgi:hypothetical protein
MSSSSLSPLFEWHRAQAIRQNAIIEGHEREPIPFAPVLFARKSRRYLEQLVLGAGSSDIIIDSTFDRDSVVQFICLCQGSNIELTLSNIFELELLLDEWDIDCKKIRRQ